MPTDPIPECNCYFRNDNYKAPEQHAATCPIRQRQLATIAAEQTPPDPITDAELAEIEQRHAVLTPRMELHAMPSWAEIDEMHYHRGVLLAEINSVKRQRDYAEQAAYPTENAKICELEAELTRLRTANAEMVAALEPFAEIWKGGEDWADCKVAAETLARHEAKGEK